MGKVFSWEEVKWHKVPRLENFGEMAQQIRHDLERCDGIVGGILCGSVLWGSPSVRSDLDCVLVYDFAHRHRMIETLQGLTKIAFRHHIPIEFIPLDREVAATPLHHIGRSFAEHLRHATRHGGVIKKNIMPMFDLKRTTPKEDVAEYLRHKLRKLEKNIISHAVRQEDEFYFLRKVLEVAVHVARKMLWWQKIELMNDSKQEVVRQYERIASPDELRAFTLLIKADQYYADVLDEQLREPRHDIYQDALRVIKEHAPIAGEFVRLNALRLASRNGNHKKKK